MKIKTYREVATLAELFVGELGEGDALADEIFEDCSAPISRRCVRNTRIKFNTALFDKF